MLYWLLFVEILWVSSQITREDIFSLISKGLLSCRWFLFSLKEVERWQSVGFLATPWCCFMKELILSIRFSVYSKPDVSLSSTVSSLYPDKTLVSQTIAMGEAHPLTFRNIQSNRSNPRALYCCCVFTSVLDVFSFTAENSPQQMHCSPLFE